MPLPKKVSDLIPALNLIPHPENGFFVETFRSGSIPMSTQGKNLRSRPLATQQHVKCTWLVQVVMNSCQSD